MKRLEDEQGPVADAVRYYLLRNPWDYWLRQRVANVDLVAWRRTGMRVRSAQLTDFSAPAERLSQRGES